MKTLLIAGALALAGCLTLSACQSGPAGGQKPGPLAAQPRQHDICHDFYLPMNMVSSCREKPAPAKPAA